MIKKIANGGSNSYQYYPPKDPCIYLLYDSSDKIIYIGETTKLAIRLYSHSKDPSKKDWTLKFKHLKAPQNLKARKFYEAYLVLKYQPTLQKGDMLKPYVTIVNTRRKEKSMILPGYGKFKPLPENVKAAKESLGIYSTNSKYKKKLESLIEKDNAAKFSNYLINNPKAVRSVATCKINPGKSIWVYGAAKHWMLDLSHENNIDSLKSVKQWWRLQRIAATRKTRAEEHLKLFEKIYKARKEQLASIAKEPVNNIDDFYRLAQNHMNPVITEDVSYNFYRYKTYHGCLYEPWYVWQHNVYYGARYADLEKECKELIQEYLADTHYYGENYGYGERRRYEYDLPGQGYQQTTL